MRADNLRRIREYRANIRRYFADAQAEICHLNLGVLQVSSCVGTFLLLFFFLITPYIVPGWKITLEYWLLLPTLVGFSVFSTVYRRREKQSYRVVQTACTLMYALLLTLFVALSVFPYPDDPESFISLCYMFMPVLFILRPYIVTIVILITQVVFTLLVYRFKSDVSIAHDVFSTTAAMLFSHVVMLITYSLRLRDYTARMDYLRISMTDSLTTMLNRGAYEEACRTYFQSRQSNALCAMILIDIDDFKRVNDTYGHQCGDELIRVAADCIRRTFRHGDPLGRVGGDEFCVLMRDLSEKTDMAAITARLNHALGEARLSTAALHISCSLGVVTTREMRVGYEDMFRVADEALYVSKKAGKSCCTIRVLAREGADEKSTMGG